jgi:hypothetical protein
MMDTCATCRWWGGRISGSVYTLGSCRRYPPSVVRISDRNSNVRPTMRPTEYCGEHQARAALSPNSEGEQP